MSYIIMSGPVMFQSNPSESGYMTLMNVTDVPRMICSVKKQVSDFKSPSMLWLYGGDRINIEDMKALCRFMATVVKHGTSLKTVAKDALVLAIAIRVGLQSTNQELQELLKPLKVSLTGRVETDTGVNTMMFDKKMLTTFDPVALAKAFDINLVITGQ